MLKRNGCACMEGSLRTGMLGYACAMSYQTLKASVSSHDVNKKPHTPACMQQLGNV